MRKMSEISLDCIVREFSKRVDGGIVWRDTHIKDLQYYYAESELYLLRNTEQGIWCYAFVTARSPKEAANTFMVKSLGWENE